MSNLHIALIIQLIDPAMEDDLKTIDLRDSALFLISQLVNQLSLSLVVVKVPLIVSHVRVQLHLHLMLVDGGLLLLSLECLQFLSQLLSLVDQALNLLLTHGFLLVELLVVSLILHGGVLLE